VRLLLDDSRTSGIDMTLAALDAYPNIEVRLFNPFVIRQPRLISYVLNFSRANRRMHNKSFTVGKQATIIGGRNVGDEHFGVTDSFVFVDLDVMAVGPVVKEASRDFDRYWASGSSYSGDRLLPPVDPARSQKPASAAAGAAAAAGPAASRARRLPVSDAWPVWRSAPAELVQHIGRKPRPRGAEALGGAAG
jgi:putative cardiolipin synthase